MLKIKYACLLSSLLASIAFVSWFFGHLYSEQVWFMNAAKASDVWASHVRKEAKPCIILAGGSEVRTRYDPKILLEEFSLRAINYAEHAGYGLACNAAMALSYAKPGDYLLISFNGVKSSDALPTSIGMSAVRERLGIKAFQDGIIPLNSKNIGMLCCGKTREFSGALREFCSGKTPYFAYPKSVIHASGWMEVRIMAIREDKRRTTVLGDSLSAYNPDKDFIDFVHRLQTACREKKVALVWFVTPQFADKNTKVRNAWQILALLRHKQKVLKDEQLGVNCNMTSFADTNRHPAPSAAKMDTKHLGEMLQRKKFWTEEELEGYLRTHGFNPDGSQINKEYP